MYKKIILERDVPTAMRDGTILYSDIFRPDTDQPVPAILSRTPYSKAAPANHELTIDAFRAAEAGYAVVLQDVRGRFQSEGEFYPFFNESQDGYDSVEWVAAQEWCDGAIGMAGGSYIGATQWLAALAQPPHLKAISPFITSAEYYEGWTYQGGAFQYGLALFWTMLSLAPETAVRTKNQEASKRLIEAANDMDAQYWRMPFKDQDTLRGVADYYFDWVAHVTNDVYWQEIAINQHYDRVQVPVLNMGGWYDIFIGGTLENFVRMQKEGGSEVSRSSQRLLIGPWSHGVFGGIFPDMHYGALSGLPVVDITHTQLHFFDYYLKGIDNGLTNEPPVRIFVMGENVWRNEHEFPLARTQYTPWYLHSDGQASRQDGTLSLETPVDEPIDVYLYDPRDPTPTVGGPTFVYGIAVAANAGPKDQCTAEARPDVLVYTSEVLSQPVEITGPLAAILYASTSAPDTDFVVRLCDVFPDEASRILAEGIIRARYRNGTAEAHPIKPDEIYKYEIDLVAISNVFLPGHRIRVDIMSSSFPRFDANPNTGNPLGHDARADMQPALQGVFHDREHPSHILLPIIPR